MEKVFKLTPVFGKSKVIRSLEGNNGFIKITLFEKYMEITADYTFEERDKDQLLETDFKEKVVQDKSRLKKEHISFLGFRYDDDLEVYYLTIKAVGDVTMYINIGDLKEIQRIYQEISLWWLL